MRATDLPQLAAPFASSDVGWKPGAVTRDKTKGLAMAYINSRAIQDRLDDVCGPADWRNEFRPGPDGGVVCGLSVYVERDGHSPEWVTKWDGADNTDVEAVKGGLSGSMKRAAVMWGIGRSLYALEAQWVRLDERGRFAEPPRLPRTYTESGAPARGPQAQARAERPDRPGRRAEASPAPVAARKLWARRRRRPCRRRDPPSLARASRPSTPRRSPHSRRRRARSVSTATAARLCCKLSAASASETVRRTSSRTRSRPC